MMISVGTPLPLEGAYNVRDLGGYLTSAQRPVQKKRYLRGASLSRLTPGDREFLLRYGLSAVIDLRSPFEAQRDPDPDCGVPAYSFPLLDSLNSQDFQGALPESLSQMYIQLLGPERSGICGHFPYHVRSFRLRFISLYRRERPHRAVRYAAVISRGRSRRGHYRGLCRQRWLSEGDHSSSATEPAQSRNYRK